MRRLFAALMLVLALPLAACSGDASASTETPPAGQSSTPPPSSSKASVESTANRSEVELATNEPFPTASADSIPQAVLARLQHKQSMLLFYYDSTMPLSKDQRSEIDAVLKEYRGLIDLVAYDEAKGPRSSRDPEVQKAMRLAGILQIRHAPYLLFVDSAGRITFRRAGFVDRGLLEREVLRATE